MCARTSIKTPYDASRLYGRSFIYGVLARLLRHPRISGLHSVWNEIFPRAMEAIESVHKSRARAHLDVFKVLSRKIRVSAQDDWIGEYETLLGHVAHGRVPAYELEYGEPHSHRQPHELADIAAYYQAFGLRLCAGAHERVDHAAVECEFMHFILFRAAYAWEHHGEDKAVLCQDAAKGFLETHPGHWMPAFTLRLAQAAAGGVLQGIAEFAFEFLVSDCESLGIKAGPRDLPLRRIQEKVETGCVSCALGAKSAPDSCM